MKRISSASTASSVLPELVQLRRELHACPEPSGAEVQTAQRIRSFLARQSPDELIGNLGGHGVAAIYRASRSGPTVLLRCDLDAVPVSEPAALGLSYASRTPGLSHKCGHDGHMAMMAGVAALLSRQPPPRGSVALLFQPAEENGAGAAAVLADRTFADRVQPTVAFACHNLPGFPLGRVLYREGVFAWASVGIEASLQGFTSHAGYPEQGRSPASAMAELLGGLAGLPSTTSDLQDEALVTIVHARLGERAFGTAPGKAELLATLRAARGEDLQRLKQHVTASVADSARRHELDHSERWVEEFPETHNDGGCVQSLRQACEQAGIDAAPLQAPFRWSEDFGHFTRRFPGALFGLGAGEDQPPLHHPSYDFPEQLIGTGMQVFAALIEVLLGEDDRQ